ncbi:MAG: carboxypeptidase regulatory-like domain-containing protein, partial [Acidobacteria bacterium]|nr:carboxypeptidase regulatory-like domain-containing protein [Acidobacteriota bacterium]
MRAGIFVFLGLSLVSNLFAQAQINSGDLRGSVVDPAGAAVPRAKVIVSDPARGASRSAEAGDAGEYRIPLLPPGVYRVRFEAPGFAVKVVEGVEVRVGDTVVLRTELEINAVATEVTVAAESAVIETERTQQSNTIESLRIRNLPINRR